MIEKILNALQKRMDYLTDAFTGKDYEKDLEYLHKIHEVEHCIEIVKEVATEYNNGWIPCSDTQKCPNVSKWCARYFWVTLRRTSSKILFTEKLRWIGYLNRWEWCNGRELSNDYEVIAWREYFSPEPYQPKGE